MSSHSSADNDFQQHLNKQQQAIDVDDDDDIEVVVVADDNDEDHDSIPDHTVPYYLQDAFTELYNDDGLLCIGKGLQYLVLLALFCKYYSSESFYNTCCRGNRSNHINNIETPSMRHTNTNTNNNNSDDVHSSKSTSPTTTTTTSTKQQLPLQHRHRRRRPLIFVLGLKDEKERATLLQILSSWDTTSSSTQPTITMITNESGQSKDREVLYANGGVIGITSRILIVDLLSGIIPSDHIYGLLLVHAHTVTEQSTEAFIIRIYKSHYLNQQQQQPTCFVDETTTSNNNNEKNHSLYTLPGSGFVKAITDNADALITGFAQVDKILKALHVRKLYLYPRFHHTIRDELERVTNNDTNNNNTTNTTTIEVIEYHQELTVRQKDIQSSIAVLVMQCLRQLKQQTEHLVQWSSTMISGGGGPNGQNDIDGKEGLLVSVENCVTQQFDLAISRQLEPHWYKLSHGTKQLVQDLRTLKTLFVSLIQYDCVTFYKLLCSIRTISAASRYPSMWLLEAATDILFKQAKERVYTIVHPPSPSEIQQCNKKHSSTDPPALTTTITSRLVTMLEENPKWNLLKTVLDEIRQDFTEKQNDINGVTNVLVMVKDDKVLETIKAYLSDVNINNNSESDDTIENDKKKNTKRTRPTTISGSTKATQQRRAPPRTLLMKWLRYLEHVNDRSRNITDSRGSTDTLSEESRLLLEEEGRIRRILFSQNNGGKQTQRKTNQHYEQQKLNSKKRPGRKAEKDLVSSKNSSKTLNQIPAHVRQRRRIATEKGRGQFSSDDILRRVVLDEAIGITEHDMDEQPYDTTAIQTEITNNVGDKVEDDDSDCQLANQNDDGEEVDDDDEVMFRVSYPNNELRVVLHCYSMIEGDQSHLLLQDVRPKYVVFYDTDVAFIRSVEVYAALAATVATSNYEDDSTDAVRNNVDPVRVYFLMFEASAEEKNYKKTLEREQNAFERLIHHKKTMPVPVLQSMETQEMQEAMRNSTGVAGTYMNGQYPLSIDTRRGKGKANTSKERRDIAVDVREFRSALPNILHQGGMRLAPVTLTVGDFVLSNVHCVERKSISDLFGSFASGRLYTQAESMSKYYACPCLLIEFDPNKSFCLQNSNELGVDIRIDSVCSKMVLLVTHFPKLRILWSRTPQSTLNMFRDLKVNHEEVDVERAIEIGRIESEEYLLQPDTRDGEEDEINEAARDMLLRLPGVTVQSARRIMQECDSLADLSQLSRDELRRIAGPATGQKLFTFFRQHIGAT